MIIPNTSISFSDKLINWYQLYGRHDLPWQIQHPYIVWVSEVMLQQTQVKTVIPYFQKFMAEFPTVHELANAEWELVANLWAGLGYYARARNLHKSAMVVSNMLIANGNFPSTLEEWQALSGIGQSTAGAIMSMGLGQYGVIMDGNVKRVLTRYYAISDDITKSATTKKLWQLATELTPLVDCRSYSQAIMDLGATLCTRTKPNCPSCPFNVECEAYKLNKVQSYPYKPQKKAKPTKKSSVLILSYQDKHLWIQRPQTGIWGGLWSYPLHAEQIEETKTINLHESAKDVLSDLLIENNEFDSHQSIKHTLTHFHWLLTPQSYELSVWKYQKVCKYLADCNIVHQWLHTKDAEQLALPKAMLKVLGQL